MPNHVTIKMEVSGPGDVLGLFAAHITQSCEDDSLYFDFNTIIPMPKALDIGGVSFEPDDIQKANMAKYGYGSWYDFNTENWGTKWNSYENNIEFIQDEDGARYVIEFQTAWSLPTPIFEELNDLYPELNFYIECVEEGGWFAGTLQYHGDTVVDGINESEETWEQMARLLYENYIEGRIYDAVSELEWYLDKYNKSEWDEEYNDGVVEYLKSLAKYDNTKASEWFAKFQQAAELKNIPLGLTFQP